MADMGSPPPFSYSSRLQSGPFLSVIRCIVSSSFGQYPGEGIKVFDYHFAQRFPEIEIVHWLLNCQQSDR